MATGAHGGRNRYYVSNEGSAASATELFARRLNQILLERCWTQADLTRAAQQHMPKGKHFGRHLPSNWLTAKNMPSPLQLDVLSKALNMSTRDLLPEGAAVVTAPPKEDLALSMSGTGMAHLKLDMDLPPEVAMEILKLVKGLGKTS